MARGYGAACFAAVLIFAAQARAEYTLIAKSTRDLTILPVRPSLSADGSVALVGGRVVRGPLDVTLRPTVMVGRDRLSAGSVIVGPRPPAERELTEIHSVAIRGANVVFSAKVGAARSGVYACRLRRDLPEIVRPAPAPAPAGRPICTAAPLTLYEGPLSPAVTLDDGPRPGNTVALASDGTVAFSALNAGQGRILRGEATRPESFVTLQYGFMTPDVPGGLEIQLTAAVDVNAAGEVALWANHHSGGGPFGGEFNSLFVLREPTETVADVSTIVDKKTMSYKADLSMDASGHVYYMTDEGIFEGDPVPFASAREEHRLVGPEAGFLSFRRAGSSAPGRSATPVGSALRSNEDGAIAFEAQLSDGRYGVFLRAPDGSISTVLAEGYVLTEGTVVGLSLGDINDRGQIALHVTVRDGTGANTELVIRGSGRIGLAAWPRPIP